MGRRSEPILLRHSSAVAGNQFKLFFSNLFKKKALGGFLRITVKVAHRGTQRPPGVENPEGKGVLKYIPCQ